MSDLSKFTELEEFLTEELKHLNFHVLACANVENDNHTLDRQSQPFKSVVLVGNVGSSFWPEFSSSPEYLDGCDDPLDRYSKRHIELVASLLEGVEPVFPSDGPPYAPFQQWAMKSGVYHQSPMAILVHKQFGLWTAFRGAFLLPFELQGLDSNQTGVSPCSTCDDKPCLTACPVQSFRPSDSGKGFGSYDVGSCRALVSTKGECFDNGCLSRRACPINPSLSYSAEQVNFHMRKFISD